MRGEEGMTGRMGGDGREARGRGRGKGKERWKTRPTVISKSRRL